MRPLSALPALLLLAALAGCASGPGTPADYGPKPTDPMRVMRDYLRVALKDPYSAQIEMRAVGQITNRTSLFTPMLYAWGICAEVNAKNAFGGYTGFKPVIVLWRADRGIVEGYGTGGDIEEAMARAGCRHVGG